MGIDQHQGVRAQSLIQLAVVVDVSAWFPESVTKRIMNFHTESTFSRRSLLQVGALGAGLTLADGLRLRAADKAKGGLRSAIFVFLEGGPSHQDTFDLKPQAAACLLYTSPSPRD